jgi:endonuclease/exonuclease/phosphatase family metal-dependent hydrolase
METEDKTENKNSKGELFDLFADWLIKELQRRHDENSPFKLFLVWLRRAILACNIFYLTFLIFYSACIEILGQKWWLTAVATYLPQNIWLIPLFFITLVNLYFYRRLLILSAICLLIWFFFTSKFNLGFSKNIEGEKIVVLTNNIGQDNKESLSPFLKAQNPDIVLLQEASSRGRQFTNSFPEFRHFQIGEFAILTKYKILTATNITLPDKPYRILGARFEIDFKSNRVAVYNIHIPSPRSDLHRVFGLRLFAGLVGIFYKNGRFENIRSEFDQSWQQRNIMYEHLISVLKNEELPFIASGDFNIPNYGPIYREFTQIALDSFKECGIGWGYTFPGDTRNPISLFGPWLRIDYIFAGKGFSPVSVSTEPKRRSQHRAVATCLAFNSPK